MAEKNGDFDGAKLVETEAPDFTARVEKEAKFLRGLFSKEQNRKKKKLILKIIEETAFQKVTMEDAKAAISEKGLSVETVNASQRFTKERPEVETYNKFQKMYAANIDRLIDLLPAEAKAQSKLQAFRAAK